MTFLWYSLIVNLSISGLAIFSFFFYFFAFFSLIIRRGGTLDTANNMMALCLYVINSVTHRRIIIYLWKHYLWYQRQMFERRFQESASLSAPQLVTIATAVTNDGTAMSVYIGVVCVTLPCVFMRVAGCC